MKKIECGEHFSVGVPLLDDQHRELIRMINSLIDHQDAGADSEPVADVLQSMTQYAAYHFSTEEQLLKEYDYPEYASHHGEHTHFKTKDCSFLHGCLAHKNALGGSCYLLERLADQPYLRIGYEVQDFVRR